MLLSNSSGFYPHATYQQKTLAPSGKLLSGTDQLISMTQWKVSGCLCQVSGCRGGWGHWIRRTRLLSTYTDVCCKNVGSVLLEAVLVAKPCMPLSAWSVRAHGVEMSLCCTNVRVITCIWSATHPVHLDKKSTVRKQCMYCLHKQWQRCHNLATGIDQTQYLLLSDDRNMA